MSTEMNLLNINGLFCEMICLAVCIVATVTCARGATTDTSESAPVYSSDGHGP